MSNPDSILDTVKKALGLDSRDTTFDLEVTMFINSALGSLKQLGVGSDTGFIISDNATLWSQYISDLAYLGMIKSYIFMSVKLAFDPPPTSFSLSAYKGQIEELAWRINIEAEHINPPTDPFGVAAGTSFEYGVMKTFIAPKVVQLTYASTVTPNASDGNVFYLTLDGDCTINSPVSASDGQHMTLDLTSNGHIVTWRGWDFGNGGLPVLSTGGQSDIISAYYKETEASWRAGFATGF